MDDNGINSGDILIIKRPRSKVFLNPILVDKKAEGICIIPEPKKKERGIKPTICNDKLSLPARKGIRGAR